VEGCPVGVDIPGFIGYIKQREFTKSIRHVWQMNSLPAVAQVCPRRSSAKASVSWEEGRSCSHWKS
jgi:glutamate synthase (NADPH/NADH) small chain